MTNTDKLLSIEQIHRDAANVALEWTNPPEQILDSDRAGLSQYLANQFPTHPPITLTEEQEKRIKELESVFTEYTRLSSEATRELFEFIDQLRTQPDRKAWEQIINGINIKDFVNEWMFNSQKRQSPFYPDSVTRDFRSMMEDFKQLILSSAESVK